MKWPEDPERKITGGAILAAPVGRKKGTGKKCRQKVKIVAGQPLPGSTCRGRPPTVSQHQLQGTFHLFYGHPGSAGQCRALPCPCCPRRALSAARSAQRRSCHSGPRSARARAAAGGCHAVTPPLPGLGWTAAAPACAAAARSWRPAGLQRGQVVRAGAGRRRGSELSSRGQCSRPHTGLTCMRAEEQAALPARLPSTKPVACSGPKVLPSTLPRLLVVLPIPHSATQGHAPVFRCLSALPRLRPACRPPYRAHTRRKSAAAAMHTRCSAALSSRPSV